MTEKNWKFTTKDGVDVHVTSWIPENPKAVVQIAHGMAEHRPRYKRFAEALTKQGFAVYANDHRGHGETAGAVDKQGFFAESDGWMKVMEDMNQLSGLIKKEQKDLPLFLFGHSMGSFLTRTYITKYGENLKGAIICGTGGNQGALAKIGMAIAKSEARKKGQRTKSPKMDKLSFGGFNKKFKPNRTGFDWLSRDNAEVDKYIADPYCGEIFTAGFYVDLLGGVSYVTDKNNIAKTPKDLPLLIISGAKDPVGADGKGVKWVHDAFAKAGVRDLSLKLYDGARHEILNETNRDEVCSDILNWLNSRI